MHNNLNDLENTLLPWLGRTMKLIDLYITDQLQENNIDLTKVQMLLLFRLKFNDGQPQNDLAFITNRDKASLARLLNTMERKNLLARIPSKTDKRINLIYITKQGSETFEKVIPTMKKIMAKVQKGIARDDINFMINLLNQVQSNIGMSDLVAHLTTSDQKIGNNNKK